VQLSFRTRTYRLRRPLRSAWGELVQREVVEVELRAGDGRVGRGEAAPLEPYDGVPLAAVMAALDAYSAVVRVLPERVAHAEVVDACAAERPLPQALAAIDLALWDLDGQRAGCAASHLIAAGAAPAVAVNAVVGDVGEALAAVEDGYECLKLKVGLGDDARLLAAVRAAVGPDVALRIDANGAWPTVDLALRNLEALAPAGLELCEEPVHGAEALAAVAAASPVAIAADESAGDLLEGGVDAVCLKISRCGGISGVLRDAKLARAAGMRVYLASTFDGPAGILGALQAASGLAATGDLLPCGLATLGAFEDVQALPVTDGVMALPPGEGLGLS
jgi:L-alanine-DL-glutamate epimerase-like enolase superfamily enzyme